MKKPRMFMLYFRKDNKVVSVSSSRPDVFDDIKVVRKLKLMVIFETINNILLIVIFMRR